MATRHTGPDSMEQLCRRLDIMIFLLLESGPEPSTTVTEKIERLASLGLSDVVVGGIVGKKPNYVGATRSRLKKQKEK